MTARLQNKVAMITGGCSGIGLETAELFIAEGARVVVADIAVERGVALQKRFPNQLHFVSCDVTREADVAAAIGLAVSEFGGLDITFNNAGSIGPTDSIENMQTENWDRVMNTLLRSVMFGIKHSIKPMKLRGGGAIVNTSSISGVTTAGPVGYCVAKAAVIQLTRVAAIELGRHKIRVNALLPGMIPTAIFGNVFGMSHEQSMRMVPTLIQGGPALAPIPRSGSTRDVAEACLYLASDASTFVTGTELRVDGGITLLTQMGMDSDLPGTVGGLVAEAVQKAGFPPGA
jgi:NAD(P)-dependent dehydrogenase (short-subunit alcohol dehydrogenase family)